MISATEGWLFSFRVLFTIGLRTVIAKNAELLPAGYELKGRFRTKNELLNLRIDDLEPISKLLDKVDDGLKSWM